MNRLMSKAVMAALGSSGGEPVPYSSRLAATGAHCFQCLLLFLLLFPLQLGLVLFPSYTDASDHI